MTHSRSLVIPVLLSAALHVGPLAAQGCPPAPDVSADEAPLREALREAPNETTARALSNQLWELWTTAPDARAQALLDRAMGRRASYDFDAADAALDELVAYCPDYAEGYNQRAFVAFLRQDFGAALEDLERALAIDPDHIGALSGQALTLMGLGRMRAAQSVLRSALDMNPWLPERGYLIEAPGDDI